MLQLRIGGFKKSITAHARCTDALFSISFANTIHIHVGSFPPHMYMYFQAEVAKSKLSSYNHLHCQAGVKTLSAAAGALARATSDSRVPVSSLARSFGSVSILPNHFIFNSKLMVMYQLHFTAQMNHRTALQFQHMRNQVEKAQALARTMHCNCIV